MIWFSPGGALPTGGTDPPEGGAATGGMPVTVPDPPLEELSPPPRERRIDLSPV
jgi:hypothetical protein